MRPAAGLAVHIACARIALPHKGQVRPLTVLDRALGRGEVVVVDPQRYAARPLSRGYSKRPLFGPAEIDALRQDYAGILSIYPDAQRKVPGAQIQIIGTFGIRLQTVKHEGRTAAKPDGGFDLRAAAKDGVAPTARRVVQAIAADSGGERITHRHFRTAHRQRLSFAHRGFMQMLPTIQAYARGAFAHLNPEARQDLIQEVIANALVAYVRLYQQGRVALAYPTVLARYGIAQVRDGRRVGAKLNIWDPLSRYCQKRKGVVVERLDVFDEEENAWAEAVVEDTRTAGVADIAFRLDFPAWLSTLSRRDRHIAKILALGHSTSAVAKRFDVSAGRVSQLRRELAESWREFTGGNEGDTVA